MTWRQSLDEVDMELKCKTWLFLGQFMMLFENTSLLETKSNRQNG